MAGKYANYIMVNRSWEQTLRGKLTVEQCGEVFLALFDIANGKESGSENILVDTIIGLCGDEIKQNIDNYTQKCEVLRDNRAGKNKKTNDTNDNKKTNVLKERMNDGRIERRTEGLLSNPSGLERTADSPPMGGSPQENKQEPYLATLRPKSEEHEKDSG
jgi:hypothetical protein